MGLNRREMLRAGVLVGGSAAITIGAVLKDRASSGPADGGAAQPDLRVLDGVPAREHEDVLVTMQRELARALRKPPDQRRWLMVIDTRKCVGCHACTIGCVAENGLPPGVVYRPVVIEESGEFPNLRIDYTPRPCMQCDAPSCTPVCPVEATWKRKDGVVVIDYDRCIGCRYCLTACPYGARTSDFGEAYTDAAPGAEATGGALLARDADTWERQPGYEYAKRWDRSDHGSPMGNARKCHFCLHRLQVGQLPVCVTTCIGRATYFGDASDPESTVSRLIAAHRTQVLLPHKHTLPRVHYIV